MTRRMTIAGNWKMHGQRDALAFFDHPDLAVEMPHLDRIICPPSTLLAEAARKAEAGHLLLGGQDCHIAEQGAHTGDISAEMVADAGAKFVIVGHSERRADHGESDALVKAKAEAALKAGLTPIICVGESRKDREAGRAQDVVGHQLDQSWPSGMSSNDIIVAYEPVWAIGTGLTASTDDIADMHAFIRGRRDDGVDLRILYGGSVKPDNAGSILGLADVDGALISGASLDAASFAAIAASAPD